MTPKRFGPLAFVAMVALLLNACGGSSHAGVARHVASTSSPPIADSPTGRSYHIPSCAMFPTLRPGYHVIVMPVIRRLRTADIVVFRRPASADQSPGGEGISRVVGLPGERLQAKGSQLLVNSRVRAEPYLGADVRTTSLNAPVAVPSGYYFLMGDNRVDSYDSRAYGAVAGADIVGIVSRILPDSPAPGDASGCTP